MLRALIPFVLLLASAALARAAPLSKPSSDASKIVIRDPTYQYLLKEGRNKGVCRHMLRVFKERFTHLWDEPPFPLSRSDLTYSPNSKYAFPLIPGVKHSMNATFEMRFSVQPTSPEFAAIHWREGRAVLGGCPACPWDHKPLPILVAYLDFDNDGTTDTAVQLTFDSGKYSAEHVFVWRGQVLKMDGLPSLWALQHPQNRELTPIAMSGTYLRPFIYNRITYVATYEPRFDSTYDQDYEPSPNPVPAVREDMLIDKYHFTGQKDQIGRPEWNRDTICDLRMKRLKD